MTEIIELIDRMFSWGEIPDGTHARELKQLIEKLRSAND